MPEEKYILDDTKKNIKVDQLTKEDRKHLLNKFIEAGGKLIEDKLVSASKNKLAKASQIVSQSSETKSTAPSNTTSSNTLKSASELQKLESNLLKHSEEEAHDFFSLLGLRLKARNYGISSFFGNKINVAFMMKLTSDLRQYSMALKLYVLSFLDINKELGGSLIVTLKSQDPEYLTIIQKSVEIFKKEEASFLIKINYSEENLYYTNVRKVLLNILRKLYYLKLNQAKFQKILNITNTIVMSSNSKSKNTFQETNNKVYIALGQLMGSFFNRLLLLIQRMELSKIIPGSLYFERSIEYVPPEKIKPPSLNKI